MSNSAISSSGAERSWRGFDVFPQIVTLRGTVRQHGGGEVLIFALFLG